MRSRNIDIMMLQETHSDQSNEIEWGLQWGGKYALSPGSNEGAGVATLFRQVDCLYKRDGRNSELKDFMCHCMNLKG